MWPGPRRRRQGVDGRPGPAWEPTCSALPSSRPPPTPPSHPASSQITLSTNSSTGVGTFKLNLPLSGITQSLVTLYVSADSVQLISNVSPCSILSTSVGDSCVHLVGMGVEVGVGLGMGVNWAKGKGGEGCASVCVTGGEALTPRRALDPCLHRACRPPTSAKHACPPSRLPPMQLCTANTNICGVLQSMQSTGYLVVAVSCWARGRGGCSPCLPGWEAQAGPKASSNALFRGVGVERERACRRAAMSLADWPGDGCIRAKQPTARRPHRAGMQLQNTGTLAADYYVSVTNCSAGVVDMVVRGLATACPACVPDRKKRPGAPAPARRPGPRRRSQRIPGEPHPFFQKPRPRQAQYATLAAGGTNNFTFEVQMSTDAATNSSCDVQVRDFQGDLLASSSVAWTTTSTNYGEDPTPGEMSPPVRGGTARPAAVASPGRAGQGCPFAGRSHAYPRRCPLPRPPSPPSDGSPPPPSTVFGPVDHRHVVQRLSRGVRLVSVL